MNDIISVSGLKKSFDQKQVLKDVNFKVSKGDFAAIIGANGSGKSTIVNIITKMKRSDSGTVKYNFSEKDFYKHVGIQFQNADFDVRMKVKTILELWKDIYKVSDKRYNELISFFDLERILNNKIANISGGEKQKMNIFLALINDPDLLILDELTTGLDAITRIELRKYLKKINKEDKKTIIMVSHYMDEVQELCNKAFFLKDGIIYESGTITELMDKYDTDKMDQVLEKLSS